MLINMHNTSSFLSLKFLLNWNPTCLLWKSSPGFQAVLHSLWRNMRKLLSAVKPFTSPISPTKPAQSIPLLPCNLTIALVSTDLYAPNKIASWTEPRKILVISPAIGAYFETTVDRLKDTLSAVGLCFRVQNLTHQLWLTTLLLAFMPPI